MSTCNYALMHSQVQEMDDSKDFPPTQETEFMDVRNQSNSVGLLDEESNKDTQSTEKYDLR